MAPNLFDKAISSVPRMRAWMFSSVASSAGRRTQLPGAPGRLEHRQDGDLVVAHAHAFGHVARVDPRDVGGVGRRHHHAAHPVGAQRVDRNRQHQGRIHAAAQADDGAREAVLADVVAHAGHQGGPGLGFQFRHRLHGAGHACRRHASRPHQVLIEAGTARGHLAPGVDRERGAVEHHLVLAAHQMRIQQRQAGGLHALHHAGLALAALVEVEGRGVEHAQHLGTGGLGGLRGFVEPGVFADQQAETAAAGVEDHRALPCIAAETK
jgi:hypothetical protein